jgi:hypothetical protein
MTLRTVGHRTGATLAVAGAVVSSLALASPAPADSSGMLFGHVFRAQADVFCTP